MGSRSLNGHGRNSTHHAPSRRPILLPPHPGSDHHIVCETTDGFGKQEEQDPRMSITHVVHQPKTSFQQSHFTLYTRQYPVHSRAHYALHAAVDKSKRKKRPREIRRARQTALHDIERLLSPCVQPPCLLDQPWIDVALHDWFNVKRPRSWMIFDLELRLGVSADKVCNRVRYITMSDPAIFCIEACASAFFSLPKDDPRSLKKYIWLENHAFEQINLALDDPVRRLSSPTIVAIVLCASYCAFCGDVSVARDVHVPGLRRALALKGGEVKFREELPTCIASLCAWYAQQLTTLCGVSKPIFSWAGPDGGDVMVMVRSMVSGDLGSLVMHHRRDALSCG